MKNKATLVYADAEGNILDWPDLEMAGACAGQWEKTFSSELIALPQGSELFLLPDRLPVGYNADSHRFEVLSEDPFSPGKPVRAVAAFISPAYTHLHSPAYKTKPGAPLLPLFAYTAVGWLNGSFVVPAVRIDSDRRQDFCNFDLKLIERNARKRMQAEGKNRLIQHLGKCALTYGCPAAKNLFMKRWEAPLPSSPECNARCIGCISRQEGTGLCATQDRIDFVPTPEEISEVAIPHLREARRAVVSFGQGCEGEPLLQAKTLEHSIQMIRKATGRGTINLNTNGSLPDAVERLCGAGLQSIRVSINSARPQYYQKYFHPKGFSFEQVCRSLRVVKAAGGFASINYFVLPGFTDQESEWQSLRKLISETGLDLIQMRNLNIDPQWYVDLLEVDLKEKKLGMSRLIAMLRDEFPDLKLGYFNPPLP
ncbi:MAG: radical SAM protein [Syntrophobacteraceae bacterium]